MLSLVQDIWNLHLKSLPEEHINENGGPGQSRTADQRFRKPLLYPSELQGHIARSPIIANSITAGTLSGRLPQRAMICRYSMMPSLYASALSTATNRSSPAHEG